MLNQTTAFTWISRPCMQAPEFESCAQVCAEVVDVNKGGATQASRVQTVCSIVVLSSRRGSPNKVGRRAFRFKAGEAGRRPLKGEGDFGSALKETKRSGVPRLASYFKPSLSTPSLQSANAVLNSAQKLSMPTEMAHSKPPECKA